MNGREQISCDVCLDLIPLVRDGVASADSEELVQNHIQTCNACKGVFESGRTLERSAIDDKRVLRRIKRGFFWAGMMTLFAAVIFGAAQTLSFGMFYNIIIMPLVGALGSFLFGKRWYLLPAGVFLLTPPLSIVVEICRSGWGTAMDQWGGVLIFALIYALLVMAGTAIAALFRFAFRKEEKR